jgi:hypothetical protein
VASHSQSNWAGASVVPLARDILARSVQIESKRRRSEQDTSEDSPDCLILNYPSDSLSTTLQFSLLAAVVIFSKMNPQMQGGYRPQYQAQTRSPAARRPGKRTNRGHVIRSSHMRGRAYANRSATWPATPNAQSACATTQCGL